MPVRMVCMSHSPLMLVPALKPREREAERGFYAALRELDGAECEQILIESPPGSAPWAAVLDRLRRACG